MTPPVTIALTADGFLINLECVLMEHRRRLRDCESALKAFSFRAPRGW